MKKYNRFLLLVIAALFCITTFADTESINLHKTQNKLKALENSFDGKIGVYAIDNNSNRIISYRADEYFPLQSTSKLKRFDDLFSDDETTC